MSTIIDSMVIAPGPEVPGSKVTGLTEVIFANCECCGLKEECTASYFDTIRERYGGKWICGLCAEAVKDELLRCQKLISPDEAMDRHFNFCTKFRATSPPEVDPAVRLIRAMSHVLRKSLLSPKFVRSMTCSPTNKSGRDFSLKGNVLTRSESCLPSLSLVELEEASDC